MAVRASAAASGRYAQPPKDQRARLESLAGCIDPEGFSRLLTWIAKGSARSARHHQPKQFAASAGSSHPIQAKEASRVRDRRESWRGKREEFALALTATIPTFRSSAQPTSVCRGRSQAARRWRPVDGGAAGFCEAPRPRQISAPCRRNPGPLAPASRGLRRARRHTRQRCRRTRNLSRPQTICRCRRGFRSDPGASGGPAAHTVPASSSPMSRE
jgi:hypothetical protein